MRDGTNFSPVHASLPTHPKTRRLARALGVTWPTAVGTVVALWTRTLICAPSGDLSGLSAEDIAEFVGWSGDPDKLMEALRDCGWMDGDQVHDWDLYCGFQVKKKEKERTRSQARRAVAKAAKTAGAVSCSACGEAKTTAVETGNDHPATAVATSGRPSAEEIRGEEIRLEEINSHTGPAVAGPAPAHSSVDDSPLVSGVAPEPSSQPSAPPLAPATTRENILNGAFDSRSRAANGRNRQMQSVICDCWAQATGQPRAQFTPGRAKALKAAFSAGRLPSDVLKAVEGIALDDFLSGRKRGQDKAFNDLSVALRDQHFEGLVLKWEAAKPKTTDDTLNEFDALLALDLMPSERAMIERDKAEACHASA